MFAIIAFTLIVGLLFYYTIIKPFDYFKQKRVKHEKPTILFGHLWDNIIGKRSMYDINDGFYKKFENERVFGIYQFLSPIFIIKDIELIKDMTIKDFQHFHDHQTFSDEEIDPLWSKNLLARNGQKWRDMRSTLSPSFTGNKLRILFKVIDDCAKQMVNYFLGKDQDIIKIEAKDFFTRYTNDVIATCAFGLQCDSFTEPNNEFYKMGVKATDFTGFNTIKFFLYDLSPRLMKLLNIKLVEPDVANFFSDIIRQTISMRKEKGLIRPDMIHILMEAQRMSKLDENEITIEDMTAQAFIFFLAGFDTTSSLITFMAYELSKNKDIQDKLIAEIDSVNKKEDFSYDDIAKLKYLDMIISETLRLWPPVVSTNRKCTMDYVIEPKNKNEKTLLIEKDSLVWFPVFSIHRDPKYYKDPLVFDPERFSDENKNNIPNGAYLPFGIGPRICIGNRFALMETKILLFKLLSRFEFVPTEKTFSLNLDPKNFNLMPIGGMCLGLKKRVK